MIADFTGSATQAVGPVNAIYAVTASAVYNAFLHLTDPTIPRNEGCYRPFTIIAPPGTIVNCSFPAPVAGGNTETSPRITDMVFGALQDAIPERVAASCGGTSSPFLFGGIDPRTDEPYAHFHFEGVGWGGRHGLDGNNMVVTINGNCRNTPVEVFETRYPAFRIESYRLVQDSGGPGEFRGGLGGERIFTVTVPEVTVSALLNRMKTEPWGVLGGGDGAVGGLWVRRAGEPEWRTFVQAFGTMSPSKFSGVSLHEGDQVKILMPGGGGYGGAGAARPRARASRRRGGVRQRAGGAREVRAPGSRVTWESGWRTRSPTSRPTATPARSAGIRSPSATGVPRSAGRRSSSARPSTSSSTTTTGSRGTERRRSPEMRTPVLSQDAPPASGGYSQGIVAGGFLFLAGQGPYDPSGNRTGSTVAEQVRQVLSNLDAVARAAGGSLQNAVRVGMYISDMAHFDEMDAEYRGFFSEPMPARTTIQSDLVGFDVEGDAVVWLGD